MDTITKQWPLACAGVFALILLGAGVAGATDRIALSGASFDFGTVPTGATLVHQVWVKAVGDPSIKIGQIKTCCGCRATLKGDSVVTQGDSIAIVIRWHTRGYVGVQERSAYLYLDEPSTPVEIKLQGNVVTPETPDASLNWTPKIVRWSGDTDGRPQPARVMISNNSGNDLAVLLVEAGKEFELRLPDSLATGTKREIEVTINDDFGLAEFESSFTIELVGNQTGPIRVSIPIERGDFSFRPGFTTSKK